MIELYCLATSIFLYVIGSYCLAVRENIFRMIIGLEILASATNLNFVTFATLKSSGLVDPLPHVFVILLIAIDGCVIAVGLALILAVHRQYGTLDTKKMSRLRW